jgi:hypothetical protein
MGQKRTVSRPPLNRLHGIDDRPADPPADEQLIPDPRGVLTPAEQIEGRLIQSLSAGVVSASILRTGPVRVR